jgi:hypothetical protein
MTIPNPIAERRLSVADDPRRELTLTIGHPEPDPLPGGDWRCPFQIVGLDPAPQYAHGVDSLQALCIAIDAMRSAVEASGLSVSWDGGQDTGIDYMVPGYLPDHLRRKIERCIEDTLREFAKRRPGTNRPKTR